MKMTATLGFKALLLLLMTVAPADAAKTSAGGDKKAFAFVVTEFFTAIHATQFMEECPEGLTASNDENWWLTTPADVRARVSDNGTIEPVDDRRHNIVSYRGPNNEDVCWNPTVIKDPPLRTVRGRTSYGMNLDGTEDGRATPKTCAHEKFVGFDGATKVDNQLYRVMGCIYGWRQHQYMESNANRERRDTSQGVILIEVNGVESFEKDGPVEVSFYRAVDIVPKDASANIIPYASFRIDDPKRYSATARGVIKNGVLTTEPIEARLPFASNGAVMHMALKDMRVEFRARKDAAGMEGMIVGYQDVMNWWQFIRQIESLAVVNQFSCPALYEGAWKLADGYPDPKTGQCTALSSAFTLKAIPAYVIHSTPRQARGKGRGQ